MGRVVAEGIGGPVEVDEVILPLTFVLDADISANLVGRLSRGVILEGEKAGRWETLEEIEKERQERQKPQKRKKAV